MRIVNNFIEDSCTTSDDYNLIHCSTFNTRTTLSRIQADLRLMVELGTAVGTVWRCLDGFHHAAFRRRHLWDLAQFYSLNTIQYLSYVDDSDVRACIQSNYDSYQQLVLPVSNQLPTAVIIADCNDANVIVNTTDGDDGHRITGLIDFSDAVDTWSCNEIAITMAYGLLSSYGRQHRYKALAGILVGYSRIRRLDDLELQCLPILIVIRLSMSVMIGAYSLSKDPDNEYLKLHSVPAREAIQFMCASDIDTHTRFFQQIQDRLSSAPAGAVETDADADVVIANVDDDDNNKMLYDDTIYDALINQIYRTVLPS